MMHKHHIDLNMTTKNGTNIIKLIHFNPEGFPASPLLPLDRNCPLK